MATDGELDETMYNVLGKFETNENETKTGELKVDGTVTADGTEIHDETATETTTVDGTAITTLDGIDDGKLAVATIAMLGDDDDTAIYELGKDETNEKATKTGDDHVDGTVTESGTEIQLAQSDGDGVYETTAVW
jgi:hypothetical protein